MSIEQLLIWVHPGYTERSDLLIGGWENVIKTVADNSTVAILETTTVCDQNSNVLFYGDWAEKCNKPKGAFSRKVGELEELAKDLLGERFQLWPKSMFVDGSRSDHVVCLESMFGARCFDSVMCYGLLPNICVSFQTNFAQGLAREVKQYYLFPSDLKISERKLVGVPTPESEKYRC